MADRSISVRLRMNVQDFQQGVRQAASSLDQLIAKGGNVEKVAQTGLGRMEQSMRLQSNEWQTVGGHLTKVGAGMTAIGAAVAVTGVNYNKLQQSSRAALTTMLGSAQAANAQMDKLDEFARNSPFSKATFIKAQQQMLAFGIETKNVIPYMDALQNAVAAAGGSNNDIAGLAEIMAKIKSSAKITAVDLMQFGNYGVDAATMIGNAMGMTGAQIREAITAGTLDADLALDALAQGMSTKFDGAAANVKNTFDGALDRVKAAFRDLSGDMMEPFVGKQGGGILTGMLNGLADLMRAYQKLPEPIKAFTSGLGASATTIAMATGSFMLLAPKARELHQALTSLAGANVPILSKAFQGIQEVPSHLQGIVTATKAAGTSMSNFGLYARIGSASGMNAIQALGSAATPVFANIGRAAKSAGSALLGAFGGWVGLGATAAITGLTMAISHYSQKAAEAKQFSQDYAASLDEVTGAATKSSNEIVANKLLESKGIKSSIELLKDQGVSYKLVAEAVKGNSNAQKELNDLEDKYAANNTNYSKDGRWEAINRINSEVRSLNGGIQDQAANQQVVNEVTGEGTSITDEYGNALGNTTKETKDAAEAAERYLAALQGIAGIKKDSADSMQDYYDAQAKLNQTLAEAPEIIAENAEAGKDQWDTLSGIKSEMDAVIDSTINLTDANGNAASSAEEVSQTTADLRDKFIGLAEQAGYGAEEAGKLADEMGLIPENKVFEFKTTWAGKENVDDLRKQLDGLPDEVITQILSYGDRAIEVADAVSTAINEGIPVEKVTDILAEDNASTGVLIPVEERIRNIPEQWMTDMLGNDGTSEPAKTAKGNVEAIPPSKNTDLKATNYASSVISAVQAALDGMRDRTVNIFTNYVETRTVQENRVSNPFIGVLEAGKSATGGAIRGPGTGTSDSIPTWLSNGEHVVTAREVELMGGQGNMYAVRQAIHSGALQQAMGFANGGAVDGTRAVYIPTQQASSPVVNFSPPDVNVTVYAANPITGKQMKAEIQNIVIRTSQGKG